eukprot:scaffold33485_cov63-Phaeocystis_antarctica.AAC.1
MADKVQAAHAPALLTCKPVLFHRRWAVGHAPRMPRVPGLRERDQGTQLLASQPSSTKPELVHSEKSVNSWHTYVQQICPVRCELLAA